MKPAKEILYIFLTIFFCQYFSAQNVKRELTLVEKTYSIDSICTKIDKNTDLVEGLAEGGYVNHKGGWETYDLKNKAGTELFRIVHNSNFDGYTVRKFYYWKNRLIKAMIEKQDWNSGKMKLIYSATYYFDDNIFLKSNNENPEHSTSEKVQLWGENYLKKFFGT